MATITPKKLKSGTSYLVRIRRSGLPDLNKTFKTKVLAEKWAREQESQIDQRGFQSVGKASTMTFAEALTKYIDEHYSDRMSGTKVPAKYKRIEEQKKGHLYKFNTFKNNFKCFNVALSKIQASDMSTYRKDRQANGISNHTIQRDYNLISCVFKHAISEWDMSGLGNPATQSKKPSIPKNEERNILPHDWEMKNIIEELNTFKTNQPWFKPCMLFQLYVGLRRGETAQIEPKDINLEDRSIELLENKTDFPRKIPLSTKAIDLLKTFTWGTSTIFTVGASSMSTNWIEFRDYLLKEKKIEQHIRLHDLRHYAVTEYINMKQADGTPLLQIHHIRQITGHKSLDVMFNIYAKKLDHHMVTDIQGF